MPLTRPLLRADFFLWVTSRITSLDAAQHQAAATKRWMLGQELFTRTMNQSDIINTRTPSNAPAWQAVQLQQSLVCKSLLFVAVAP